jgi:flavodoxin
MKALIIYDSAFGNTAQIARTIGDALSPYGEVSVCKVDTFVAQQLDAIDLLIVGSPTQGFRATAAITHFLKEFPSQRLSGVQVAAFDTRIAVSEIDSSLLRAFIDFGGYAAKRIARQLERSGGELIAPAEGFIVEGKEGPLKTGECERAADWARGIAEQVAQKQSQMRASAEAVLSH